MIALSHRALGMAIECSQRAGAASLEGMMTTGKQAMKCLVAATLAAASFAAIAQQPAQRVDLGKREFDNNCAVCHGRDAKAAGRLSSS